MADRTRIELAVNNGALTLTAVGWPGFRIAGARCGAILDGKSQKARLLRDEKASPRSRQFLWQLGASGVVIEQMIAHETPRRIRFSSLLRNGGGKPCILNHVDLLAADSAQGSRFDLGASAAQVRILENHPKRGQVRSVGQIMTGADGRRSLDGAHRSFFSEAVTLFYSVSDETGLLIGFESLDRFAGRIRAAARTFDARSAIQFNNVDGGAKSPAHVSFAEPELRRGDRFATLSVGFPGAELPVGPGETVELGEFVVELGSNPHRLLEEYAERTGRRYNVRDIPLPFANWSSWYGHRLGVNEETVLANARAAKERHLDKLGLKFMQVDLGWEKDNVPTFFEENERFSHGLNWLSRQLDTLGLGLGAWIGFTCVSENHPVARDHPEWLVQDEDGKPVSTWTWFWAPHDKMYNLDITHPGARAWVEQNVRALAEKGVRYLKWDFGGNLSAPGKRHDPSIACSRANEGMRMAGRIVRNAINSQGERGLVLDVSDGETANLGLVNLLYANVDTGNSGLGFSHLRSIYTALGTHLFKNGLWGLIQPSCLVMGLPGTLEEARMRGTAAFLSAGHVDISDDLTILPEERWQVLLSLLPPVPRSARVVDLFHPVRISPCSYVALCQGEDGRVKETSEPQGAVVWHMPMRSDWDQWDLVAFFHFFEPEAESSGSQVPLQFAVDLKHLGLDPRGRYWAYEFWTRQFLGALPLPRRPKGSYRHPGDSALLASDSGPGVLDVAFQGPAIRLLVLRAPRKHPWPIGTTFHLSGGMELSHVRWDAARHRLSGVLHRPPGQSGAIVIAGADSESIVKAQAGGEAVPVSKGANGSLHIPVITRDWKTMWSAAFS